MTAYLRTVKHDGPPTEADYPIIHINGPLVMGRSVGAYKYADDERWITKAEFFEWIRSLPEPPRPVTITIPRNAAEAYASGTLRYSDTKAIAEACRVALEGDQ